MNTPEADPASPRPHLSRGQHILSALAASVSNSIAALLILPPHVSETSTHLKPGAPYALGVVGFTLYLLAAPRFFPRFWCSAGAAVGNALSVAVWGYLVWTM
jgi:hypothetical protein